MFKQNVQKLIKSIPETSCKIESWVLKCSGLFCVQPQHHSCEYEFCGHHGIAYITVTITNSAPASFHSRLVSSTEKLGYNSTSFSGLRCWWWSCNDLVGRLFTGVLALLLTRQYSQLNASNKREHYSGNKVDWSSLGSKWGKYEIVVWLKITKRTIYVCAQPMGDITL